MTVEETTEIVETTGETGVAETGGQAETAAEEEPAKKSAAKKSTAKKKTAKKAVKPEVPETRCVTVRNRFRDRYTGKLYRPGDTLNIDAARERELRAAVTRGGQPANLLER